MKNLQPHSKHTILCAFCSFVQNRSKIIQTADSGQFDGRGGRPPVNDAGKGRFFDVGCRHGFARMRAVPDDAVEHNELTAESFKSADAECAVPLELTNGERGFKVAEKQCGKYRKLVEIGHESASILRKVMKA